MNYLNFEKDKVDQHKSVLNSLSPEEIKEWAKQMSLQELALSLILLQEGGISDSHKKLLFIFFVIHDRPVLEYLAKYVETPLFLDILSHKKEIENGDFDKISSILIGLQHDVFNQALFEIEQPELLVLQQEASAEPLQHQLTIFSHYIILYLEEITENLKTLEYQMDSIDVKNISRVLIDRFLDDIENIAKKITTTLKKINHALLLAWNTYREDLIDSLSFQKECWNKYDKLVIGYPRKGSIAPKGLYARLEEKLSSFFSSPEEIEGLNDHEPAIEALVKFSIWYLQDYWELGLLPEFSSIEQLDLDSKHTEKERADFRADLYLKARRSLEERGLHTVADLKRNQIFSKEMLKDFLKISLDSKN